MIVVSGILATVPSIEWVLFLLGTRIIYDRAFLMHCRNSPLAKSPPTNLPKIPGVTSAGDKVRENGHPETIKENQKPGICFLY